MVVVWLIEWWVVACFSWVAFISYIFFIGTRECWSVPLLCNCCSRLELSTHPDKSFHHFEEQNPHCSDSSSHSGCLRTHADSYDCRMHNSQSLQCRTDRVIRRSLWLLDSSQITAGCPPPCNITVLSMASSCLKQWKNTQLFHILERNLCRERSETRLNSSWNNIKVDLVIVLMKWCYLHQSCLQWDLFVGFVLCAPGLFIKMFYRLETICLRRVRQRHHPFPSFNTADQSGLTITDRLH